MRKIKLFLKKIWLSVFKEHPYTRVGAILDSILPESYKKKYYNDFWYRKGLLADIMRHHISRQHYMSCDDDIRKINRNKLWGGDSGKKWHDVKKKLWSDKDEFEKQYLKLGRPLALQITDLISSAPGSYHTVCDMGTGNGMFLNWLSGQVSGIRKFIGIDLNKEQVAENKETYKNTGLEFFYSEITDWINTRCGAGTIFVTCGVFEYFAQHELVRLFESIRNRAHPAAIAIIEPINLDLVSEFMSKPRGNIAYSHNYPYLFNKCGYNVFRQKVESFDPKVPFYSCVIMVATL
ncbi:MAG: hypothetical protein A2987_00355 [Omnitrophica bacterium RIFCSPLOWO2_01_FULL_45_10]|nr:MAG: hypothetical protein A2987_00355 [Omnitrophica bacterium RIFCSPLOWO2_01_FULL_45_10]